MGDPARQPGPQRDTLIAGVNAKDRIHHGSGPSSFPAVNLVGMSTCDFCGRQEDDEAKTITWTTAVENGRRRVFCDTCSRDHLRAMEGKLDSEWW
jgi:hypothetical protein